MNNIINIREATEDDISNIVKIHISAFPNFFLTDLGKSFLTQYYGSILKFKDGILLIAERENQIQGFCDACYISKDFNKHLIKSNLYGFIKEGFKLLIKYPNSLKHLYLNLSKKGDIEDDGQYAELLSIGVRKSEQGLGIGKALIEALEKKLKASNIQKLSLTTDKISNDKTLAFYSIVGFKIFYEFNTYPNRTMLRLLKNL